MKLEGLGIPTVLMASDAFEQLAHLQAESLGLGAMPTAIISHPLGGCTVEEVMEKAAGVFDEVDRLSTASTALLTAEHYASGSVGAQPSAGSTTDRIAIPSSYEGMASYLEENGLGDDLPAVPPTEERVADMLSWSDRDPQEVIGLVFPTGAPATVEKIAANAVMAGCKPHQFPLVVAAVRAITRPEFNLLGLQATTHPVAPLLVFNGPLAREAGLNGGEGLFGPGSHGNTTIGRAIRLVMLNIGGGGAGRGDKATHGQPGKFSFCIAENEAASPWAPRHVDEGFPLEASTITVVPGEAPHNIHDSSSTNAKNLLDMMSGSIAQMGSNNSFGLDPDMLLIIGPEHANLLAREGIDKAYVRQYLFETARIPLPLWPSEFVKKKLEKRFPERYLGRDPATTSVGLLSAPEKLLIIVGGGAGKHSMHVPTFGTPSTIEPITLKSGAFAMSLADFRR